MLRCVTAICTAAGEGGAVSYSCTELEHTGFSWGSPSYQSDDDGAMSATVQTFSETLRAEGD